MWAIVDCDNFFCSCERVFRPDLRHKPLVALSNNDGCVVARSKVSKAMGVQMGTPWYQAQDLFRGRGLVAFSNNYVLYADLSSRVMAVLRQEAPEVLQYSIDESFLNLNGFMFEPQRLYAGTRVEEMGRGTGAKGAEVDGDSGEYRNGAHKDLGKGGGTVCQEICRL